MADDDKDVRDWVAVSTHYQSYKNDGITCEIDTRQPTLQSILSGHKNFLSIKVSTYYVSCYITCYITRYILAGAGCIDLRGRETAISNS